MSFDTDVLISGAGAAGLTLAIDLARRGVSFQLIEQNAQPFNGSRGKGIQPRTMEIFEDLGIVDRMVAAGGPYPPLCQYRPDGTHTMSLLTEADVFPTAAEPYAAPLMLPQFATEAVMRERLAELGYYPHFGTRLTGFEQDAHGVTARMEQETGEQAIRACFLVGTRHQSRSSQTYPNCGSSMTHSGRQQRPDRASLPRNTSTSPRLFAPTTSAIGLMAHAGRNPYSRVCCSAVCAAAPTRYVAPTALPAQAMSPTVPAPTAEQSPAWNAGCSPVSRTG